MSATRPRPARFARRTALLGLLGAVGAAGLVASTAAPAAAQSCEQEPAVFIPESSGNLERLAVPQAWPLATGAGVRVAVVDSGVRPDNPHLRGAVVAGRSFVPGERSGRADSYGQGTALAGVIAARRLPGGTSALVGVAPEATIVPVRAFRAVPTDPDERLAHAPTAAGLAEGIRWASANDADVIAVAASTGSDDPDLRLLESAVSDAHRKGALVIAAAEAAPVPDAPLTTPDPAEDAEAQVRYPAASEHALGVVATDTSGVVGGSSARGQHVDVAAPGSNVLATSLPGGDCLLGTSEPDPRLAVGYVSGLAAQLVERFPDASPDEIAYRVQASAERPRRGRRDDERGWGLIRPHAALTMTVDPQRAGPEIPGVGAVTRVSEGRPTDVQRLVDSGDPLDPARERSLRWGLLLGGAAAVAVVVQPLARRRFAALRRRHRSA